MKCRTTSASSRFTWGRVVFAEEAPVTTSEPTPLLAVSQLNAAYEGSQILRDVNLTLPERQLVAPYGSTHGGQNHCAQMRIVGLVSFTSGRHSPRGTPLNEHAFWRSGRARALRACAAGPLYFSEFDGVGNPENQPGGAWHEGERPGGPGAGTALLCSKECWGRKRAASLSGGSSSNWHIASSAADRSRGAVNSWTNRPKGFNPTSSITSETRSSNYVVKLPDEHSARGTISDFLFSKLRGLF